MKLARMTAVGMALIGGAALTSVSLFSPIAAQAASLRQATIGLGQMSTLDPSVNGVNVLLDEGTLFEGLYGFSPTYHIEKKIATGYTVTDGGKVWTFSLRKNARWSNGQPVTANDFYYAWMRIASPADSTGLIWASVMEYVKNAFAYQAGEVKANQVGLKVINPYKIQLTLAAPYDILPELAISGSMPLYPPDVENHGTQWFLPQYFVGNGPYKVKSFVANGEIQLVRNPYYVGASGEFNVGNLQQITIQPAPSVPVEDFLSHALNIAMIGSTSDYQYVLKHAALKAQLHSSPDAAVVGLEWDHAVAKSPLDNVKVRQAIGMAINRTPLVNVVLDGMAQSATAMGPNVLGAPKYEHALPFNVAKAKALLKQAGYPNGKGIPQLDLYTQSVSANPQQVNVAEALEQEFKSELGINFKIITLSNGQWDDIVYDGLNQWVNPGYVISWGSTAEPAPAALTVQANQQIGLPGSLGGPALRQYATDWYFDTYDARDVKTFGNPANPSAGLTLAEWTPIQAAVTKDSAWLKAYDAKQPAWYQQLKAPQPGDTETDIFNSLLTQWKSAKTTTAKHDLWVTAWKMVGSYSLGNGQTALGLNGEVYLLQHQSTLLANLTLETDHLGALVSLKSAQKVAAQVDNTIMNQGYDEPLYIPVNVFLESSDLTGAVGNPYFWNGFEDFQYLTQK